MTAPPAKESLEASPTQPEPAAAPPPSGPRTEAKTGAEPEKRLVVVEGTEKVTAISEKRPAAKLEDVAKQQKTAEQKAAEQKAAEQQAAKQKAAEQKAAEQQAAKQRAAEQKAAEQQAAKQRAAEQKAAEQEAAAKPRPTAPLQPAAPLQPVPAEPPRSESTKEQAKSARRARGRRLLRRLALFVVAPTITAGVYYGAVASPQFESFSVFSVQSSEVRPTFGMEGILASMGSSGGSDALAVRDYALSRDMLKLLNEQRDFIRHYQDTRHDWISRLKSGASFEEAYEYYGNKVYADYDQASGSVTLRVRAFSARKAHELAQSVLQNSEEMVNRLSERQRQDRTRHAEAELKLAEQRLVAARAAIVALQQKYGDFNPQQTAGAAMQIRTALEGELAKARAELMQLKSFMNDQAPQVLAANEKIKSLSAQIAGESRRLVDPSKAKGLHTSMADFEAAMTEKEFAEKIYASALSALELARADAARQHRYLAVIASPSTPDESTYPHRVRSVLATFVLAFLLLGVGSLIGAAVREHARL